jgi:LPS O-antigen subunit length determinant protein (WzzB/FepE family)
VIHKRNGYLETNEEIRKDEMKQKLKLQRNKCEKRKESRIKAREVRKSG